MKDSPYTCSGPLGHAQVLPVGDDKYCVYRWYRLGLYIEGAWSGLEDAAKCARAVTGCGPSSTAG